MIFTRANPLQGPLEGVGPENRDNLEMNSDMESAYTPPVHKRQRL
jgi:hypothetical protein